MFEASTAEDRQLLDNTRFDLTSFACEPVANANIFVGKYRVDLNEIDLEKGNFNR
ncbi:hypothetical protein [Cytobacillus firmus]|uniref:hypothetical protein n=1 Tax=Cytobacillus firmus TaxID=1399 RepID=UPI0018CFA01E|nr:hypothetical protein [Cytobacillus firmus]